jgi:hypothetical protein
VRDRTYPHDTQDTAPSEGTPATLFPAHRCGSLAMVLPITTDWTEIHNKIDSMVPNGKSPLGWREAGMPWPNPRRWTTAPRRCPTWSNPSMYYDMQQASQLNTVFTAIALNLANLRISKWSGGIDETADSVPPA